MTKRTQKIKRTMTLTIVYESESMSKEDMINKSKRLLEELVNRANNEGMLTGNSDMTVDEYDYRLEALVGEI